MVFSIKFINLELDCFFYPHPLPMTSPAHRDGDLVSPLGGFEPETSPQRSIGLSGGGFFGKRVSDVRKIKVPFLSMIPLVATLLAAALILAAALVFPHSVEGEALPAKELVGHVSDVAVPLEAQGHVGPALQDMRHYLPQTEEGHFKISVANLHYTKESLDVHQVLAGQTIETIGQITYETAQDSKRPVIRVCDFGAGSFFRPARYSVELEFEAEIPHMKHREWVRLVGMPIYRQGNGKLLLSLRVLRIESTSAPQGE